MSLPLGVAKQGTYTGHLGITLNLPTWLVSMTPTAVASHREACFVGIDCTQFTVKTQLKYP